MVKTSIHLKYCLVITLTLFLTHIIFCSLWLSCPWRGLLWINPLFSVFQAKPGEPVYAQVNREKKKTRQFEGGPQGYGGHAMAGGHPYDGSGGHPGESIMMDGRVGPQEPAGDSWVWKLSKHDIDQVANWGKNDDGFGTWVVGWGKKKKRQRRSSLFYSMPPAFWQQRDCSVSNAKNRKRQVVSNSSCCWEMTELWTFFDLENSNLCMFTASSSFLSTLCI